MLRAGPDALRLYRPRLGPGVLPATEARGALGERLGRARTLAGGGARNACLQCFGGIGYTRPMFFGLLGVFYSERRARMRIERATVGFLSTNYLPPVNRLWDLGGASAWRFCQWRAL